MIYLNLKMSFYIFSFDKKLPRLIFTSTHALMTLQHNRRSKKQITYIFKTFYS